MLFLLISIQQWVVISGYELGTMIGSGSSDDKDTDLTPNSVSSVTEEYEQGNKIQYRRQVKHRSM